jgi:outer membrane protein assembly factor BamB
MCRLSCLQFSLCFLFGFGTANAVDWTQFRGPGGKAVSDERGLPEKWSSTENVIWKTELPGPGTSSPIVLGDRVYLTSYSGYGLKPNEGDQKNLKRHVFCMDRKTGGILWKKTFDPKLPESGYRGGNSSWHGYASSTPTTDGKNLYVFFGKSGLYCLDLKDGKQVWQADVGKGTHGWGSSNSPVLYKDLVIVNASVESRSLFAFHKKTGKQAWKVDNIRSSWNTPILVDLPDGKTELVLSVSEALLGIDPTTGKELWRCSGFGGYVCPSVVADSGTVYVVRSRSHAIKAGGKGDVVDSPRVVWKGRGGSVVPSPVFYKGHLYWIARGTAICLDAKTGKTVFQKRLSPRPGVVYASVIIADGKLYCVTQKAGTFVLAAKPEFELLAHNVFKEDNSRTNASPIVSNGQLLMRTDRYLYCLGKK